LPVKGEEMKKVIIAIFLVLFFVSISLAIESLPERSKGISMHMLPKRVADPNGQKWGFRGNNGDGSIY